MAHFAKLDENNVVTQVIVVSNKDTADANGVEKEYIGKAFCERLLGGNWIQTSYNGNFRGRYAGIGFTYDPVLDEFIPPKPPLEGDYTWDSGSGQWVQQDAVP